MKVGYFSPLHPAPTGVADYSAALLPYLRELGDVETNPASCDVALYHIGNNSLHAEIYQRALMHPGVIVLHESCIDTVGSKQIGAKGFGEKAALVGNPAGCDQDEAINIEALKVHRLTHR